MRCSRAGSYLRRRSGQSPPPLPGLHGRVKEPCTEPPLYIAVIGMFRVGFPLVTGGIVIWKVWEVEPAAMLTVQGTIAYSEPEKSATTAPPAGAGAVRTTVPECAIPSASRAKVTFWSTGPDCWIAT